MSTRIVAAVAGLLALGGAVAIGTDAPGSDAGEVVLATAPATPTPTEASLAPTGGAPRDDATPSATTTRAPTPRATPTPAAPPATASPDAATPAPHAPAARSARLADLAVTARPAPVSLQLPTLDVTAPIVPVGVRDDGQMEVPEDVDEAGWYHHGPTPGDGGNAILAGHVDDREQGLGIFHRLVDLQVGDEVVVELDDDTTTSWRVTGRRLVDKDVLPVDDLFRREGIPQLVLVTCGGDFDGSARSYQSNVVVVAQPL